VLMRGEGGGDGGVAPRNLSKPATAYKAPNCLQGPPPCERYAGLSSLFDHTTSEARNTMLCWYWCVRPVLCGAGRAGCLAQA
jgi:hypothetical protein